MLFNNYLTLLKNLQILRGCLAYLFFALFYPSAMAQDAPQARGLTPEEYKLAREATVGDLDNDTYIKIEDGQYVLDRYEMKPPYMITGDSGIKKRLDLYKLMERESMQELGLVVFFTNTENQETFNLVIPNFASSAEVWNMYFDDIHQHDREEQDVALKMSYILSKEMAYLVQKSSGADMSAMEPANSDYDFCFPATAQVTMHDGSIKSMMDVKIGDAVAAYQDGQRIITQVEGMTVHKKRSIALSKVMLMPEEVLTAAYAGTYQAPALELLATPNHPVLTDHGKKAIGQLKLGDRLFRWNPMTQTFEKFQVYFVKNHFDTTQEVYNLKTSQGTYLIQEMVVLEK